MSGVTNDDSSLDLVRRRERRALLLMELGERDELFLDGGLRGEHIDSDASLGRSELLGRRALRLLVVVAAPLVLELDTMVLFPVRSSLLLLLSSRHGVLTMISFIYSESILHITGDGIKGPRGVTGLGDIIGNGGRPSLDVLFLGVWGVVTLGVAVGFFSNEYLFLSDIMEDCPLRSSLPSSRHDGDLRTMSFTESVSILNITGRGVNGPRGVTGLGVIIGNGGRPSLDPRLLGVVWGVVVVSISLLLMLDRLLLVLERLVLELNTVEVFPVRSPLLSSRHGVLTMISIIYSGSILHITGHGVKGPNGVAGPGDISGNGGRPSLGVMFLGFLGGVVVGVVVGFFSTDSKSWYCSSPGTESASPPSRPRKKCNTESFTDSFRSFTSGISARFMM